MQLGQTRGTPDYDYYGGGGTTTTTSPPATPAQRGPATGANQFGTPAPTSATYAHTAAVAPTRRRLPRWALRLVVPLVLLVVGGLLGVGRLGFLNPADLDLPATLGGQAASTDPAAQQLLAGTLAEVRAENPSQRVEGQAYGAAPGDVVLLLAGDFSADVEEEMRLAQDADVADGLAAGAVVESGDATCVTVLNGSAATCVRSGWTRSMTLVVIPATGPASVDAAATLLAEAWDA